MTTNTLPVLPETFKPEVFKRLIDTAPEVYQTSSGRVQKAIATGNKILADMQAEKAANGKISPASDDRLNTYLVNIRKMTKEINDARTPITQMFNEVIKLYTGLENEVSPKNAGSPAYLIQALRDEYATILAREERERQERERIRIAKEKEATDIRVKAENQYIGHYRRYLEEKQSELMMLFDETSLELFENTVKLINEFSTGYPFSEFSQFVPFVRFTMHSPEEARVIVSAAKEGKHAQFDADFKLKITELRDSLITKLPSKKTELEEKAEAERQRIEAAKKAEEARIAAEKASAEERERFRAIAAEEKRKADEAEAERKRIEELEATRKAEEAAKLQAENKKDFENQAAKLEASRAEGHANSLFSPHAMGLDVDARKPQVRESYLIKVKHALGYQVIAAFYFEKEGKNEPVEELEKRTLGQMKRFAESYAQKNGEKIQSEFLEYTEVFKSVNKK